MIILDNTLVFNQRADTNLPLINQPKDLAYVIYTSGSTGEPKGVEVEHRNVVNRLLWAQATYVLTQADRVLQKTSFNFDVSVWEVLWPLLVGAQLVVAKPGLHRDAKELADFINDRAITITHFVPSLLDLFLLNEQITCSHLKFIFSSGESLAYKTVLKCRQRLPLVKLHNLYGPTETTIDITNFDCQQLQLIEDRDVPIGKPIHNIVLYIVDVMLNPVPVGVAGELYVGGVGTARGYLNRPELTQERFIDNPFASEEDKAQRKNLRLYRTGDLVRYLLDGNIQFLGRIDQQIKIHGFRIELGEIENAIRQQNSIQDVVVIAREDIPGDKRLVAYLVAVGKIPEDTQAAVEVENLRLMLGQKLPDYMIPNIFIYIDKLPLNVNGKLERKALLKPDNYYRLHKYAMPTTEMEIRLIKLWSKVLGIKEGVISIHDNFFALGGHSLLAIRLCSLIRQNLGRELNLQAIFQHSSLKAMASVISQTEVRLSQLVIPPRSEHLPLSFAQQQLWVLNQLLPNKAAYNIPIALHFDGKFNQKAFFQAWQALVNRHESLRSAFQEKEGIAEQTVIAPNALSKNAFEFIELSSLSDIEREQQYKKLLENLGLQIFELNKAPLWKSQLIKLGEEAHVWLLAMHHIISDGWSMTILNQEISTYYQAYSESIEPMVSTLPLQYPDYSLWQREYLQGKVLAKQLVYWQEQFKEEPEVLNLPLDKLRPIISTYAGKAYTTTVPKEVYQSLMSLSQGQGVTVFISLLTTFKILLCRYTGQSDIVVGSPIAGRQHQEFEGLIGFFANTLALRTQVNPNSSFLELLNHVKEVTLRAYEHRELPFEQLVSYLKLKRELNRNPLFQVMFNWQESSDELLNLKGLTIRPLEIELAVAKFDLTLNATMSKEGGLIFSFEYAKDLFEAATIERMAKHFEILLEGIIAQPEQAISKLPLLSELERKTLLVDWNQTQVEYPQNKTIHQLFEEQVERTPDNVALIFEGKQLSYKELNEKANQLAWYLRELGVVADTLVAISLERSLEVVIGILAVLKAGGAYVPLDSSYPLQRLQFMLEDTEAPILLTHSSLQSQYSYYKGHLIILDNTLVFNQRMDTNPPLINQSKDLAYVIYTSGSTGKPKGVMVTNENLVNSTIARLKYYKEPIDSFLLLSSVAFDSSVAGIFWTLLTGGNLHLLPEDSKQDIKKIINILSQKRISHLLCVPKLYQLLVKEADLFVDSLRITILAGESISEKLVEEHMKVLTKTHLYNEYGPTEATVWCSVTNFNNLVNKNLFKPIIGRPISNIQIYVLDSYLHPVPIGVCGELCISGANVTRGYLNCPELTQKRFIDNPFVTEEERAQGKNLRLYRTGDLVQYLSDGNIEFLGRLDQQVKIRGFRIELGEVESVIRQKANIQDVVVIAREDMHGNKRLIAYLVAIDGVPEDSQAVVEIESLRLRLAQKLPAYMIPNSFIYLERLPLNINGKLEHKALPESEKQYRLKKFVAPRSTLEVGVAKIWAEILEAEFNSISIEDNFFERGGNSLLSIRLVNLANNKLSMNLEVTDVFKRPTIIQLVNHELDFTNKKQISSIIKIQTTGNKKPLFLIHSAGGMANCYMGLADLLPAQPIYGLNDPCFGEKNGFFSLENMASTYIKIIRECQPEGPYFIGGWSFGGNVALEIARQLTEQRDLVAKVILIDSVNLKKLHNDNKHDFEEMMFLKGHQPQSLDGEITSCINFLDMENSNFMETLAVEIQRNRKLLSEYQPTIYLGDVVLLRAEEFNSSLFAGWQEIIPYLKVVSVKGAHSKLFDKEYIQSVRASLIEALTGKILEASLTFLESNLFAAAKRADISVIFRLLKENPLLVGAVNPINNWSLLHWAVYHGNNKLINFLLEQGIDKTLQDKQGKTASDIVCLNQLVSSKSFSLSRDLQGQATKTGTPASVIGKKQEKEKLFKSSKDKQARIELSLETVKLNDYIVVDALSKGDCFFDACAQALASMGKVQTDGKLYDAKGLRQLCYHYALELDKRMNGGEISKEENWIYQEINFADDYNNYLVTIYFTAEEAVEEKNHWATKGLATCGRLSVDGRIISERLGVSIHWIEILDRDSVKQVGIPLLHQLQRPTGSKASSLEHQFELNYQDETLIHLVVYKSHVVPLLKFPVFSEQQSHTSVSQSKPLSLSNTNMTYAYQLLRSMTKDSLATEKPIPDSNRQKRRASM